MDGPVTGAGRFRPDELGDDLGPGEQARALAAARDLEWLAATDDLSPGPGFADRVMAAVADEPTPRPVVAAASAARRGAILGVLAAFGDLWRVAWSGGRPLAVRAPAMALVALVLVAGIGAGSLGVGALASLLSRPAPGPEATPVVLPTATPSPVEPSATPETSQSPEPSATPETSRSPEPSGTSTDHATPQPTDRATSRPTPEPQPTETPEPGHTPGPTDTPRPSESGSSGPGTLGSGWGGPVSNGPGG